MKTTHHSPNMLRISKMRAIHFSQFFLLEVGLDISSKLKSAGLHGFEAFAVSHDVVEDSLMIDVMAYDNVTYVICGYITPDYYPPTIFFEDKNAGFLSSGPAQFDFDSIKSADFDAFYITPDGYIKISKIHEALADADVIYINRIYCGQNHLSSDEVADNYIAWRSGDVTGTVIEVYSIDVDAKSFDQLKVELSWDRASPSVSRRLLSERFHEATEKLKRTFSPSLGFSI